MEADLAGRLDAQPAVLRKVRSNYRHLYSLCGYLPASTGAVHTNASTWGVSALFLVWDRMTLDGDLQEAANEQQLVDVILRHQVGRLLGIVDDEARDLAQAASALYRETGGLVRTTVPDAEIEERLQDQIDVAVARRLRSALVQLRDTAIAREMKRLYGHQCMFCGLRLQTGRNPDAYVSNAAHIRPLGRPHDGPDKRGNLLVLCLNHHAQFDRGILRIERTNAGYVVRSKLAGDPLEGRLLILNPAHRLDSAMVDWHFRHFH